MEFVPNLILGVVLIVAAGLTHLDSLYIWGAINLIISAVFAIACRR